MTLPAPPPGTYLPEIHDLAPHMAPRLPAMLDAFPAEAHPKIAHLIVPNWQGTEPLDGAPHFAATLRGLAGTPVLHGWTHSLGPDLWNRLMYGHDNRSEFAKLTAAETAERLTKGLAMLDRVLGRRPDWFCAPRWQGSAALAPALRGAGIGGRMTADALIHDDHGQLEIPALNFDDGARAPVIAAATAARRYRIRHVLKTRSPFRLVLHPDDVTRPRVFSQFRALVADLAADGWRPLGLDEVFPASVSA